MLRATKRLVSFLKPQQPGVMVVGRQLGSLQPGSHSMPKKEWSSYRHNVESMRRFWEQLGAETGSKWRVEGELYEGEELKGNENHTWSESGMRMLWFTAVKE